MKIQELVNEILKEKIEGLIRENPDITKQQIAEYLEVPYATVCYFLRKCGIFVPRPKRSRCNAPHKNSRAFQVLGYLMNNPGCTLQHVADQFGCTREYVSQIEVRAKAANIRLNE